VRHRRRYLGVVLAIALGVAGFITVVTMSREVKKNFNEDLDLIGGVTVIRIYFDNARSYRPQWFRDRPWQPCCRGGQGNLAAVKAVRPIITVNVRFYDLAVDEAFWQVRSFGPSGQAVRPRGLRASASASWEQTG
jgi:hypothetical protein